MYQDQFEDGGVYNIPRIFEGFTYCTQTEAERAACERRATLDRAVQVAGYDQQTFETILKQAAARVREILQKRKEGEGQRSCPGHCGNGSPSCHDEREREEEEPEKNVCRFPFSHVVQYGDLFTSMETLIQLGAHSLLFVLSVVPFLSPLSKPRGAEREERKGTGDGFDFYPFSATSPAHSQTLSFSSFPSYAFAAGSPLATALKWRRAGRAVTLCFDADETCSPVEGGRERARESPWRYTASFRLSLAPGTDRSDAIIIYSHHSSCQLSPARDSPTQSAPLPEFVVRGPYSVDISWLFELALVGEGSGGGFRIDTSKRECRTPRRNSEVSAMISNIRALIDFLQLVRTYIASVLVPEQQARSYREVYARLWAVEKKERLRVWSPVLPVCCEDVIAASLLSEYQSSLLHSLSTLLLSHRCVVKDFPAQQCLLLGASDLALHLLANCLVDVSLRLLHGVDSVEQYMYKVLEDQIGLTDISPAMFDEFMLRYIRHHHGNAPWSLPSPFSLLLRNVSGGKQGQLTIGLKSGATLSPVHSSSSSFFSPAGPQYPQCLVRLQDGSSIPLSASVRMHGIVPHTMSSTLEQRLTLSASSHHFSSYILLIGTAEGASNVNSFILRIRHALVVSAGEQVSLPLCVSTIPSAGEFAEAVKSLSPAQEQFCTALRHHQLSESVFCIAIVPLDANLERAMNLEAGSLMKDIPLQKQLTKLLFCYHVPGDMLHCDPRLGERPTREQRLLKVRENAERVMKVIEGERARHPEPKKTKKKRDKDGIDKYGGDRFLLRTEKVFQTQDKIYRVCELATGGELFYHLSRQKYFPEATARFYASEVLLALGYLHEHGILLGILKPENILLSAEGHVLLTDYDSIFDSDSVSSGVCITPGSLSPEILRGEKLTVASDWYSYGALVYEMLTGLPPFYTEDLGEMYRNVLGKGSGLELPLHLSPSAISLFRDILHIDPEKRLRCWQAVMQHAFFPPGYWEQFLVPPSSAARQGRCLGFTKKCVSGKEGGDKAGSLQDYEVQQVIGKGTYGKVLKVKEKEGGALLAMKVVNKQDLESSNCDRTSTFCGGVSVRGPLRTHGGAGQTTPQRRMPRQSRNRVSIDIAAPIKPAIMRESASMIDPCFTSESLFQNFFGGTFARGEVDGVRDSGAATMTEKGGSSQKECEKGMSSQTGSEKGEISQQNSERGESSEMGCGHADYLRLSEWRDGNVISQLPVQLESRAQQLGDHVRPLQFAVEGDWTRQETALCGVVGKRTTVDAAMRQEWRESAHAQLEALSRCGTMGLVGEIHMVVGLGHCYTKSIVDTVIQGNEDVGMQSHRTWHIVASTVMEATQMWLDQNS